MSFIPRSTTPLVILCDSPNLHKRRVILVYLLFPWLPVHLHKGMFPRPTSHFKLNSTPHLSFQWAWTMHRGGTPKMTEGKVEEEDIH